MRHSPELHLMFEAERRQLIELRAADLSDMAKIPAGLIVLICLGVIGYGLFGPVVS